MKLPIRGAKWEVREPEDATPVEKEAAEFVRQELFEEEIEWDQALENALLMLDFGCAAHEDVWYPDGGRIRLKKLAARLPSTFSRWIVDPQTEELLAIEQYGAKADSYVTVTVPAARLALFTFGQEGANFAGRSVMRPMYQHWYYKAKLYAIDAIACERNGMGIPTVTMGPGAKKDDRDVANRWVQQICAHERAGLVLPNEWEFALKGVEGTLRDSKDSIAHHNMMISMAGLAMFMQLGQSESGNRALGQTMGDFFMVALEATANKVARVMNWTTITRLVDLNFAGVERYPELVPQQILAMPFASLVTALKDLSGSKLVEADDDLEGFLREKAGLPEKDEKTVRKAVSVPAVPGMPAQGQEEDGAAEAAGTQKDTPTAKGQASGGGSGRRPGAGLQSSVSLAEGGRPEGSQSGSLRLSREPKDYERCLALAEIVGELDRGRDAVAGALRQARSAVQAEIVNKLVARPVRELHRVSIAPSEKLAGAVEEILRGVYAFGVRQVAEERDRQKAGAAPGEARVIRAADARKRLLRRKKKIAGDDALGVYADAIVSEFTNSLTARAATIALDWLRRPGDLGTGEITRTRARSRAAGMRTRRSIASRC
jgi:phage gp29-like protein